MGFLIRWYKFYPLIAILVIVLLVTFACGDNFPGDGGSGGN